MQSFREYRKSKDGDRSNTATFMFTEAAIIQSVFVLYTIGTSATKLGTHIIVSNMYLTKMHEFYTVISPNLTS